MTTFDVLVIGGGPGGTPLAMALASAGRRVLLVEKGVGLGGTCLFEGCIPSKILRESAERLRAIRRAREFGLKIPAGDVSVDWDAIMQRKGEILARRSEGALAHAHQIPGLDIQFGTAALSGPRQARITPRGGQPFEVGFSSAVIATGSLPSLLPVSGADLPRVLTSEQILEVDRVPPRLVVIGAGPVGVEMAQIFAAFGSRVTLLEAGPRILAPIDEEIALALHGHVQRQGIALELGAAIAAVAPKKDHVSVQYRDAAGAPHEVETELVLVAIGRHPNVEALGLEHTHVRYDRHGVKVNATMETDEPGLYALGDVVGHPMFAHWATAQALALAGHLLGRPARFPDPATNTAVIFSMPEAGMAGLTESAARAAGHDVGVARYDFRADARAQVSGHAEGLLKLVYDNASRAVLGIHILAEGAAALLGEGALAVRSGIPVEAVAAAIHPHPTLSESVGMAAREASASTR